eukprot:maker-scaffold_4-snap-gene-9.58-mRNA-1 protein AED:0.45 eAED:0.79 QI:0/0/0.33/1/0/0/3/0/117
MVLVDCSLLLFQVNDVDIFVRMEEFRLFAPVAEYSPLGSFLFLQLCCVFCGLIVDVVSWSKDGCCWSSARVHVPVHIQVQVCIPVQVQVRVPVRVQVPVQVLVPVQVFFWFLASCAV